MASDDPSHERPANASAAQARERLERGNERFRADRMNHPRVDLVRREELVAGQNPFAIVITCSDSRVTPELVFDMGLGDLFVIRVAGNVIDNAILGSIEFAVGHLGVNLVVVMGHGDCGAVKASIENLDVFGAATHDHVDTLLERIRPAVRTAKARGGSDLLTASVEENARLVAEQIRRSEPVMAGLCWQGVEVAATYYDLDSGDVRWLGS